MSVETGGGQGPLPRWLLIVRRDHDALYRDLRRAFAGSAVVHVILDRRRGDRRRQAVPVEVDQRQGNRRWPTISPAERDLWEQAGFRLVLKPHDIEVYETGPEPGDDAEEPR